MIKTRTKRGHGASVESPEASTTGLRPSSRSSQGAAGGRKVAQIKPVLCRTCLEPVEAREGDRERPWYFVDSGTENLHRCKESA